MILDRLENSGLYEHIHPAIQRAFTFLRKGQFVEAEPGRYPLEGVMHYMVQDYETRPVEQGFFESHRKFIDIQYMIRGHERHDYAHVSDLERRDGYDEKKDLQVYDGKGSTFILKAGSFALYFPGDAHMPCLAVTTPEKVFKIVVKVPV